MDLRHIFHFIVNQHRDDDGDVLEVVKSFFQTFRVTLVRGEAGKLMFLTGVLFCVRTYHSAICIGAWNC